jgi:hypothetical protein
MSLTIYQATVPALVHSLGALSKILDKAAAQCAARKIDPSVLLTYRLAPDMFPFTRQIQIVTDQAKGLAARLTGAEVPSWPDTEASFDELKTRIAKAVDYLQSFKPEQFEGAEAREVVLKTPSAELKFTGAEYAFGFVFSNFYFHAATAYNILRHNGIEIGKRDFLGA